MKPRSKLRIALYGVAGAVFLASGVLVGQAVFLRTEVKHLRDAVSALTRGDATYTDALRVADAYRRLRVPPRFVVSWKDGRSFEFRPDDLCTNERCVIEFEVDNGLAGHLRLVRHARFDATVVVLKGRVVQVGMALVGGPHGIDAGHIQYTDCCAPAADVLRRFPEPYSFHTPIGKRYLSVYFSNAANATQRHSALSLDLHCFLAFSGCGKPCDYLPLAWKDYVHSDENAQVSAWIRQSHLSCD